MKRGADMQMRRPEGDEWVEAEIEADMHLRVDSVRVRGKCFPCSIICLTGPEKRSASVRHG